MRDWVGLLDYSLYTYGSEGGLLMHFLKQLSRVKLHNIVKVYESNIEWTWNLFMCVLSDLNSLVWFNK